jgi:hypothetical protein
MTRMSNAKRLHIHSVPIAVFTIAATVAVLTLGTAGYSHNARQALIHPMVKFAPTDHGLAAVQFDKPATNAELLRQAVDKAAKAAPAQTDQPATNVQPDSRPDSQSTAQTPVLPGIAGLGSSAALQMSAN